MKKQEKVFSIKKVKSNYTATVISVLTFCLAVFTVIQFAYMYDIYAFAARQNMVQTTDEIADAFFNIADYKTTISGYEAENNLYVEIYNPKETLVYTTGSNTSLYEPTEENESSAELKPRIMKILSHKNSSGKSYFEIREDYFATAQYMVYGNFYGDDTVIEVYYPIEVIKENANTARWTVFGLCLFALILISTTTIAYASSFTKPIKQITQSTKKLSELDFKEKCPSFRIRELDDLSESINALSSSLSDALTDLQKKNIQLQLAIEKEYKLEKQRKSFVANVSHELKTPISIIQGYAEGMKYGIGCDSTEEFCDIIIDESEKMNNLVVRLMELVHYQSGQYSLGLTEFNLNSEIMTCINDILSQNADDNIKLITDIDDSFTAIADKQLFYIVLNNYVTNALSHISGDKILKIYATEKENNYRICVYNSGNQIPGSDIENIWQSFYRADKSHSREKGHFGLGLSIVASLQEINGQKYGVRNLETGVEFWFDVKKA